MKKSILILDGKDTIRVMSPLRSDYNRRMFRLYEVTKSMRNLVWLCLSSFLFLLNFHAMVLADSPIDKAPPTPSVNETEQTVKRSQLDLVHHGSLLYPKQSLSAVHVGQQKILVAGRRDDMENYHFDFEMYDVSTSCSHLTASIPRFIGDGYSLTKLSDSKVLFVGFDAKQKLPVAYVLDVDNKTLEELEPPSMLRLYHTATLLKDGRVVIAGGQTEGSEITDSLEVFDPITKTFSQGIKLSSPRFQHAAVRLPDGRVLFVGGDITNLEPVVEIYNPKTEHVEIGSKLHEKTRLFVTASSTQNGKYFIASTAQVMRPAKEPLALLHRLHSSTVEVFDVRDGTSTTIEYNFHPIYDSKSRTLPESRAYSDETLSLSLISGEKIVTWERAGLAEFDAMSGKHLGNLVFNIELRHLPKVVKFDAQYFLFVKHNEHVYQTKIE